MRGFDVIIEAAPWLSEANASQLAADIASLDTGAPSPLRGARSAYCDHLLAGDEGAWRRWREAVLSARVSVDPRLWRAAATIEVAVQGAAAPTDLAGRAFPSDLILAHDGVIHEVWLNGSTVGGDFLALRASIDGRVEAQGLVVRGRASAAGAVFGDAVDVSNGVFNGPADFSEAAIAGDAGFASTRFAAATSFQGAMFGGDARFVRAAFDGPVSFAAARFKSGSSFERARFGDDADFHGARFDAPSKFDGSEGATPSGVAIEGGASARARRPKAG